MPGGRHACVCVSSGGRRPKTQFIMFMPACIACIYIYIYINNIYIHIYIYIYISYTMMFERSAIALIATLCCRKPAALSIDLPTRAASDDAARPSRRGAGAAILLPLVNRSSTFRGPRLRDIHGLHGLHGSGLHHCLLGHGLPRPRGHGLRGHASVVGGEPPTNTRVYVGAPTRATPSLSQHRTIVM